MIIQEEYVEYTSSNKGKPEDVNMQLVGLANTRIATGYAQKTSPITGWKHESWDLALYTGSQVLILKYDMDD